MADRPALDFAANRAVGDVTIGAVLTGLHNSQAIHDGSAAIGVTLISGISEIIT